MRLKVAIVSVVLAGAAVVAGVSAAKSSAEPACKPWWPTSGQTVGTDSASQRSLTTTFTLNQAQHDNAVRCGGTYLRLVADVRNAGNSGVNYTLTTNLQGIMYRALSAQAFVPGASYVPLGTVRPGQTYSVSVTWAGNAPDPTFSLHWYILRYANNSPFESNQCRQAQAKQYPDGCLFPVKPNFASRQIFGGQVPLASTHAFPA